MLKRIFFIVFRLVGIFPLIFFSLVFHSIFLELFFTHPVFAAEHCKQWIARTVSLEGQMQVLRKAGKNWVNAGVDDTFCQGDKIRIGRMSRATVMMVNETILRLGPNTTLSFLDNRQTDKRMLVRVLNGMVNFFSRIPRSLDVQTPFVNALVDGTEFLVEVGEESGSILVFKGLVRANNSHGSVNVESGQMASASSGQAPVLKTVVRPRDAVHWALYYPQVLDASENGLGKAVQFLSVGYTDEAGQELDNILQRDPENGDAYALKAIVALVQDRKTEAMTFAEKSVRYAPNKAAPLVSLSYVQQAHFAVESALKSLQRAAQLEPENSLVLARLAELYLANADSNTAFDVAIKAAKLDPALSRVQSVLGFVYLARFETDKAQEAFNKAISLEQASPLPRLGLGLAKIRDGNLEDGRSDLDIAASLDPNNSLIRSYLGKAYFDEKRDTLSRRQLTLAKELDPLDPTPYLYDAIRKQNDNRPVEALADMQKSIELNDNRAVYRSKLLLDEDLAVRGANLAGIYQDLGFERLALVEGWKSVNTDPGNYSAHRFLADSYRSQPRHEIARVSEMLQSQLLQPINSNPVQPQLVEKNTFIVNGTGPAEVGFNEFSPLFNRNRVALFADGVVGSNAIFGEDLMLSGVHGRHSWSIAQFHYETDGFRENNDQEQDIYNAFYQVSLSPQTSLQAEYRYRDLDRGDLALRFDPDNYSPDLRQPEETRSARLGFHHIFTPGSEIIGSFVDGEMDADVFLPFVSISLKDEGYNSELQHLYHGSDMNLISGLRYSTIDREETITSFPDLLVDDRSVEYTTGYVYSRINFRQDLTLILGGSGNFFDDNNENTDQFNPKFGFQWNLLPNTSVRAAAFRTLQGPHLFSQTIEPTQIAGFNQYFNDDEGTDVWRYGIGLDHSFSPLLSVGIEFAHRDLNVPYVDLNIGDIRDTDMTEDLLQCYLHWAPKTWLTISAEYQFEEFERDVEETLPESIQTLKTHRFPLAFRLFHPSGVSGGLKISYIDQQGRFGDVFGIVDGEDQFFVVDASLRYRLPKRLGMISLEAKNILDEDFQFQDTDPANPEIYPERLIAARLTLTF